MPEFTAQEAIKSILDVAVAPPLKACGYRRSSRTWHKAENGVTKVLNVQLSAFNTKEEASFTINLGLIHPEFHSLRGLTPPDKNIKEYNCDVRARIGQLMGKGNYWWTVARNTDSDAVREDVRLNVEHVALPWLDACRGLQDFPALFMRQSRHFDAAVASHLLNEPGVPELLAAAAASAHPLFRKTLEAWAGTHGYALPPAAGG